jgi:TatD DNase family protein
MWFDSHCHLGADEFAQDRAEVAERAFDGGVEGLIAIGSGYGVAQNARAVALAEKDGRIWATVGVHPHEAAELDDVGGTPVPELLDWAEEFRGARAPAAAQLESWLELAARNLPVSIHVRGDEPDAYDELLDIWKAEGGGEVSGVLHCYTGNLAFARRALDARLDVSFSGILTFKNDRGLREVAAALPLDRLLVETDAPLLAPQGLRGRRNEPVRVIDVGVVLAQVQSRPTDEVADITTRNARACFRLEEAG